MAKEPSVGKPPRVHSKAQDPAFPKTPSGEGQGELDPRFIRQKEPGLIFI